MHDPGDGRQDVEVARGGHRGPDPTAVGDIEDLDVGCATRSGDQVLGFQQALLVEVRAVRRGARGGEQDGAGPADAARGAGDERGAACEVVRGEGHDRTVRPDLTGRQPVGGPEPVGPDWQCGHQ